MSTKIKGSGAVTKNGETNDRDLSGMAAAWVNFNGTGTIASRDSLNLSSLTDNGTGNYTVTLSSDMGNANYSFSVNGNEAVGASGRTSSGPSISVPTTSAFRYQTHDSGVTATDHEYTCCILFGDFA
jgi:hypothetical protein